MKISKRRIAANRRNARKSTGPRTEAGQRISSMNGLKHGLTSAKGLLPGEPREAFEELRASLTQELSPRGIEEEAALERIIGFIWRLRRALVIERAVLSVGLGEADARRASHTPQRQIKDRLDAFDDAMALARY